MNSENAELMKLFDEAIAHWERMIAWAKKQPKDKVPSLYKMSEKINMAGMVKAVVFVESLLSVLNVKGARWLEKVVAMVCGDGYVVFPPGKNGLSGQVMC